MLSKNVQVVLYAGDADYICNWLGVERVAETIDAKNWGQAGYTDLLTSDGIVHGQVKQAGRFSFTRFYEAGHEVPFYQPLASLEFFGRAIELRDLASGFREVDDGYVTSGPERSTYSEGNATVQFEVTPANATYNVSTNKPGPPWTRAALRRRRVNGRKYKK